MTMNDETTACDRPVNLVERVRELELKVKSQQEYISRVDNQVEMLARFVGFESPKLCEPSRNC